MSAESTVSIADPADMARPPGPDSYSGNGEPYVDDLDDLMISTFSRTMILEDVKRIGGRLGG